MFHVKPFLFLIFFIPIISFSQHFGTTTLAVKSLPNLPPKNNNVVEFLNKSAEYSSLTPTLKDWFYWTNYSRNNPKGFWDSVVSPILKIYPDFKNSYTTSLESDLNNTAPLPLVKPNLKLLNTSLSLAKELAAKSSPPSHTSPSGATFPDRMKAAGIRNCAGENISFGPQNPVLMLVLLYIDQNVPGLGHRHSLLNPSFTEMGVGIAEYADKKNSIVIQDFACGQP